MATTTATAGRNDACPCGSGRKFKKCCGPKQRATGGRLWMVLVGLAVAGGLVAAALSFTATQTGPAPGQVWSPEHGHYH